MKKILALLLAFLLSLSMIACTSTDGSDSDNDEDEKQEDKDKNDDDDDDKDKNDNDDKEGDFEIVTVEEAVIFDQDGYKVTVKSLEFDDIFGPTLKINIENNSTVDTTVQAKDFSINDMMVDPFFSSEVAAGKKANDSISIMDTTLKNAGISLIQKIEFKLHFYETESYDTLLDSEVITLTTSADPSFVQKYDDAGTTALDDDNVRIVVKKIEKNEDFELTNVIVFVENKSGRTLNIQVNNVSVNGSMIDPTFSCEVVGGKKALDEIIFSDSDLAESDITEIETLEMEFRIVDFENYDLTYSTEPITVTFE